VFVTFASKVAEGLDGCIRPSRQLCITLSYVHTMADNCRT